MHIYVASFVISVMSMSSTTSSCPIPVTTSAPGTQFLKSDRRYIQIAQQGCRRIYSNRHCLIRLHKTGHQSFWAICKLMK